MAATFYAQVRLNGEPRSRECSAACPWPKTVLRDLRLRLEIRDAGTRGRDVVVRDQRPVARRTSDVIDVTEISVHWQRAPGRSGGLANGVGRPAPGLP